MSAVETSWLGGDARALDQDHADAGGQPSWPRPVDEARLLGDQGDDVAGDVLRGGAISLGEQDGELVTAESGDQVGAPHPHPQQFGHRDDQLVTGAVAEGVVDLLEVVEVHHQQRSAGAVPLAQVEVALELLIEAAPVREPGQRVVLGQVCQLRLEAPTLGHVDRIEQQLVGYAVPVVHDDALERHVDPVAVAVLDPRLGRDPPRRARDDLADEPSHLGRLRAERERVVADEVVADPAGQVARCRVDVGDLPVDRADDDAERRLLEEARQPFLGHRQLLLAPPRLGDVARHDQRLVAIAVQRPAAPRSARSSGRRCWR